MMNPEHERRAAEMIEETLHAVASRRRSRSQWRMAGGSAVLLLLIGWAMGLGPERETRAVQVEPLPGISLIALEDHPEPDFWGAPRTLLLVMDGSGVEMRAMSDGQISALARKPGCEFAMGPDAFLIVSDCAGETERFGFGEPF